MPRTPPHAAMRTVSSRQNPAVVACRILAHQPDPAGARLLLDGIHLVTEAHLGRLEFEMLAVDHTLLTGTTREDRLARTLAHDGVDVLAVSGDVLAAMSPVRTPSGMVAIVKRLPATVDEVCAPLQALVLALTDVQDPGNLGALLRLAEAGAAAGVLVCGSSANPSGWKTVRGSMGSILRLPTAHAGATRATFDYVRSLGLRSIAAVPRGGAPPDALDWSGRVVLWLGGEGPGLSDDLVDACDARVSVPMAAPVESLNVAVAGGILLYAAGRARA